MSDEPPYVTIGRQDYIPLESKDPFIVVSSPEEPENQEAEREPFTLPSYDPEFTPLGTFTGFWVFLILGGFWAPLWLGSVVMFIKILGDEGTWQKVTAT